MMSSPEFRVFPTAEATAEAVAAYLAEQLASTPAMRLGLATGNTFVPIYAALVELHKAGGFSFARTESFNLDEYIGLPPGHPASFAAYMQQHLFSQVDLPEGRGHLPGVLGDVAAACTDYEVAITAGGGIDLQLLGIGRNGHIGFNEPGSAFDSRTREVALTPSTREANQRDFPPGESVPPSAVTMGIGTILEARQIVLVAIGASKVEALDAAFRQAPSPDCPASALQAHPNVIVFADQAAIPNGV
ncbi:MAG: glucosamine-6-phosphate isomerase [Devosia sp. 63-57]|nr:MAG: glucosamine-6-phosphate isomerase [Pelagibacterium sp. SCN 63-126]ODU85681.1 MAG: glucosamine-6-phosphate isomerase [Pelagibacterium sp. SCN 63-17]OJX44390.1 MAG: glucosamine-6-phosphate isomerase [Devosia sp. 63-57]